MNVVEYPDRDMMMIQIAQKIAGDLNSALMSHDAVSLAVPGGTTPGPIFESLSAAKLDWNRVTVLLGDERWVPEDAPRSNARLLRRHLLQGPAAQASFFGFYDPDMTPDEGAAAASKKVAEHLPISVLLLGMGADMHTASLFPGADRLAQALDHDAPPVMALTAPGAQEPRITLTAPVLRNALTTHVVITGQEKRDALDRAADIEDPMLAPVSTILRSATVHWAE